MVPTLRYPLQSNIQEMAGIHIRVAGVLDVIIGCRTRPLLTFELDLKQSEEV